jgi:hypothetical protein
VATDAPWQIIDKTKKQEVEIETPKIQAGFVAAKGSVPVKSGKKQKLEESENLSASTKKTKAAQMIISSNESSPSGLVWDGDNYNCAYVALFTILYEIWSTDTKTWKIRFKEINQHHLKSLSACFKKYMNGQTNCEYSEPSIDDSLKLCYMRRMIHKNQLVNGWGLWSMKHMKDVPNVCLH